MKYPYELPKLPYGYDALEPHIDGRTMEIHHTKHHQAYIDKLNMALEKHPDLHEKPLEKLLGDLDATPDDIRAAIRNHGGGHANHSLFWKTLGSGGGKEPDGELASAINATFGGFGDFKKQFSNTAAGVFGSGWAWLAWGDNKLHLHGLPNQDSPFMHGHVPVLGLDVWEHAYYLKYQNKRADYIDAWWNVVNWEAVAENFKSAKT